ncbi:MAG: hypothetical protein QOF34_1239 [Sphingomonadales bacterium]|nr:hypothetical protein [Sphingomonadales bacterium]
MADYYPLVAKAVAGLEKNTGEGRRMLYERARTALVAQLRGMNDPPLTEAEITRERLALEEAIRKVAAEAARRGRDVPRAEPAAKADAAPDAPAAKPAPPASDRPAPERPAAPPIRPRTASRSVTDEGLKGFRDVIAETEGLGEATAQGAKTAREAFAATPPSGPAFDRLEPRVEPEGLRTPPRPPSRPVDQPRTPAAANPFDAPAPEPRVAEPDRPVEPRPGQQRQSPMRQPSADDIGELPKHSRVGLVAAIVTVLLILALGAAAYWQRDRIAGLLNAVRGPVTQQKDAAAVKPKITDRVGQPSAPGSDTPATNPQTGAVAAVAQRVALYEEDPADQQGKRFVGTAIWRTEMVTPGPGAPPDMAVRADIEIPERRITMTFLIRRDINQVQQATSHTIEITFNLPADFPFGGISNVPGVLMKQAEQTRGSPLGGAAAKVTSGYFLIGLSAVEGDMQRNLQLLKERGWFDIPIVYNNGRRAILAIEKGTPGERAFEEAFRAWGQ